MRRGLMFLALGILALVVVQRVASEPQRHKGAGTATLTGVVIGPDDKPVAHAGVTYQSSGGNAAHAVHTDSRGRFSLTKLRADNYDLRASANGIFSEWVKNVSLGVGETKSITLQLIYARSMPKPAPKANAPVHGRPESGGSR